MPECNFFGDCVALTHLCSSDSMKVIPMHWLVFMQLMYKVIAGWRSPWSMPRYWSPLAGGISNYKYSSLSYYSMKTPFLPLPISCIKSYLMELLSRRGKRVTKSCPILCLVLCKARRNPLFLVGGGREHLFQPHTKDIFVLEHPSRNRDTSWLQVKQQCTVNSEEYTASFLLF